MSHFWPFSLWLLGQWVLEVIETCSAPGGKKCCMSHTSNYESFICWSCYRKHGTLIPPLEISHFVLSTSKDKNSLVTNSEIQMQPSSLPSLFSPSVVAQQVLHSSESSVATQVALQVYTNHHLLTLSA